MVQLDFGVVLERWPELAWGTLGTIWLALAGMTLALVIGIAGVAVLRGKNRIGHAIVRTFVEVIRNTPFLVQIFFIFFALPLAGIRLNPTATAILAPTWAQTSGSDGMFPARAWSRYGASRSPSAGRGRVSNVAAVR